MGSCFRWRTIFESEVQIKLIMERLLKFLVDNKEVNDYRITEQNTHSYQLFFVKKHLETNRLVDSSKIEVTVYVDVNGMRGNGKFSYDEADTDEEIIANIKEAVFNAKLALNPYFELPKAQDKPIELDSNLKDRDFKDIAEDVAKAVFANDMNDVLYSAATEIFLNRVETKIINSQGLKNKEVRYFGEIELIPSYDTKDKEVEVYHMMRFANYDFDEIKNEVGNTLKMVVDRYNAIDLPKGLEGINIIVDGNEVAEVFGYFSEDLNYHAKFTKSNLSELQGSVQGEHVKGTPLTMSMSPYYKGAAHSRSIDVDGITLKEHKIIEDGKAISRWGNNTFAYFIGEKNPTGDLPIIVVNKGDTPFKDMARKPYIRCVRFSAMQMDRLSGLVGGEVRLGYYFDGEKEIPVTGFTFTGNMHELKGMMLLSEEEITYDNYHGPKYILLPKTQLI